MTTAGAPSSRLGVWSTTPETRARKMATRKASCRCGDLSVTHEGPDPERISLCQCYECQRRTGSVLSVQARIPREQITIRGESTTWAFPTAGEALDTVRSCDIGGATYHFCAECGS